MQPRRHLISSDCPLTAGISVSSCTDGWAGKPPCAEREPRGKRVRLLCPPACPACLSLLVDRCQRCRFSLHLLQARITHVIRSGCHGNRQCSQSIQVGLSCAWATPSVFAAQDLCFPRARQETARFQWHLLSVVSTGDTE